MKLIVGLGNIGNEYFETRHNIGFMVLDNIASKLNLTFKNEAKFKGMIASYTINGEKILLLKPTTYMNLSGESLALVMKFYKIEAKDILVIHDDLDMDVAKIRFRQSGSAGGHNGIKSIIASINTENFNRIKIGISKDKFIPIVDYVLGHFKKEEKELIDNAINHVADAVIDYMSNLNDQMLATKLQVK